MHFPAGLKVEGRNNYRAISLAHGGAPRRSESGFELRGREQLRAARWAADACGKNGKMAAPDCRGGCCTLQADASSGYLAASAVGSGGGPGVTVTAQVRRLR